MFQNEKLWRLQGDHAAHCRLLPRRDDRDLECLERKLTLRLVGLLEPALDRLASSAQKLLVDGIGYRGGGGA